MLTTLQAAWRRRLRTLGAVARSPLSPAPCVPCSALGLRSRWLSDQSGGAPDAPDVPDAHAVPDAPAVPPAESNTAPNTMEWLKAVRRNPRPEESLRSPQFSEILNQSKKTPIKSLKSLKARPGLRPLKNSQLLRPVMEYPSDQGNKQTIRSVYKAMTAQVIQEKYAKQTRRRPMPTWFNTLLKLKQRTAVRTALWKRHALKIVVPRTQLKPLTENIDDNIWDITERTTCGIEIYKGLEEDDRLTLLLSGDDIAVQEATGIIKASCEHAWIFRPDPFNPNAPLVDADVAKKRVTQSTRRTCPPHLVPGRPRPKFWSRRFEDIPYPKLWSKGSFLNYVRRLCSTKMETHRANELYGSVHAAHQALINLIYAAFLQPVDPKAPSTSALRLALECMEKGGYKDLDFARRLFRQAQALRLQIDTSVFNSMLVGCVRTGDLANFNDILDLMNHHKCAPNYKTWVTFFNMIGDEEAKRQVVLAMDRIGFLQNPQATKDIVQGFVSFDTYRALDSGKDPRDLCHKMELAYGPRTWASRAVLNSMLLVCARFERYNMGFELMEYFERKYSIVPNATNFATLLVEVKSTRDFGTALQALRLIESRYHVDMTAQIYDIIHFLAARHKFNNVLAVVFAYACLARATSYAMRFRVSRNLARPGYAMMARFQTVADRPAYFAALPGYVPIDLWADLYADIARNPAREQKQGAVLADLYRSQLSGYTPVVPLADMIEKAMAIDERLLALEERVKTKRKGSHVVSIRAELGDEDFFEIPLRHKSWRGEDKVLKLPITSEALVNNHDKEWFGDKSLHPRMDILPWEVTLNGDKPRDKVGLVQFVTEKWLVSDQRAQAKKAEKTASGERKTLEEGRASEEKAGAEQGEAGLGQEEA